MMQILAQMERARGVLGDAFDIRAFHDLVIGSGDLPINVLARRVDRYIARRAAT